MNSSPEPTTPTDEGKKHQLDGHSGSGTNPAGRPHPTFGGLTLPKTSNVGTVNQEQESIYLGSSKVPVQYREPLSRTPSPDDRTLNERDIEEYVKRNIKKEKGKRRAAGNAPWNDQSENDDERQEDAPERRSSLRKTPRRRVSQMTTTEGSRVSKTPRTVPVRSNTNEEPGTTSCRVKARGGTRSGLRSQTISQTSQDDEVRARDTNTAIGFEDDVDKMSINDQRL
jgi:hypothetical protein